MAEDHVFSDTKRARARGKRRILWTIAIVWILYAALRPADPTDVSRWNRSGMDFYVDNGTGCHYLGPFFGGLTPRLDGAGRHMGCNPLPEDE